MTLKIKEGSAKLKDTKHARDTGNEIDLAHMQEGGRHKSQKWHPTIWD